MKGRNGLEGVRAAWWKWPGNAGIDGSSSSSSNPRHNNMKLEDPQEGDFSTPGKISEDTYQRELEAGCSFNKPMYRRQVWTVSAAVKNGKCKKKKKNNKKCL